MVVKKYFFILSVFLIIIGNVKTSLAQHKVASLPTIHDVKDDINFPDSIYHREYGFIISLTGKWDIAEGNMQKVPTKFPYKITVPGLVNNTETNFKEIGIESNKREAYWYRKTFNLSSII